jgi:ribonuclease HII
MPPDARAIRGVDDSKALSAAERTRLASLIRARALAIGLGAASVREIDRLNIYHASTLAMQRALGRLAVQPDHVLIDGKTIRTLPIPHTAVVHGDARCFSIACASIVAKVTRDRLMRQLGERYPAYRWGRNAGYATPDHVAGLTAAGLTPHHRRSFLRPRQLSLDLDTPIALAADESVDVEIDVALVTALADVLGPEPAGSDDRAGTPPNDEPPGRELPRDA